MPFPPDVCEPIPPEHKVGPPPNGEIHLDLLCDAGDCPEGQITVELIETASKKVLAAGPVNCTGGQVRHVFPMTESRPQQVTRMMARFSCGTQTKDTPLGVLWIKSS